MARTALKERPTLTFLDTIAKTATKKITFLGDNPSRQAYATEGMPDRWAGCNCGPVIDHLPDGSVEISGEIESEAEAKEIVDYANSTDGFSFTISVRDRSKPGAPIVATHEISRATPALIDLVRATPVLVTLHQWKRMTAAERVHHCRTHGIPEEAARSSGEPNMLTILPKATIQYLRDWQKWINSGAQGRYSNPIGRVIVDLQVAGFVLAPLKVRRGFGGNVQIPRDFIADGDPGTEAFVRRMMGPDYAHWLSKIRC